MQLTQLTFVAPVSGEHCTLLRPSPSPAAPTLTPFWSILGEGAEAMACSFLVLSGAASPPQLVYLASWVKLLETHQRLGIRSQLPQIGGLLL